MKKLLFILTLSFSLFAGAQADSTGQVDSIPAAHNYAEDSMYISLTAEQFAILAELEQSKSSPHAETYRRRVAIQWDGEDSAQLLKIKTTYGQFVRTYENQLTLPDGIVANFNIALLTSLLPDVMRHPWVANEVDKLKTAFAQRLAEIRAAGFKRLSETKKALLDD